MRYHAYVSYASGAKSHELMTTSRADVERHLAGILGEAEMLGLAESVVIRHADREILNVLTSMPIDTIKASVQWPLCGAPVKVNNPVAATVYMPEEVRDWLSKKGKGKVSRGLRELVEEANIPELRDAWVR